MTRPHEIPRLFDDGREADLAAYLRDRFGWEGDAAAVADLGRGLLARWEADGLPLGAPTRVGGTGWSEGSWESWLRRLIGAVRAHAVGEDSEVRHFASVFHVGLVGVVETDEHLGNLRWGDPRTFPTESAVARSRIAGALAAIRPVDRVAGRVAPGFGRDPSPRRGNPPGTH